jgi:hypothetical protein
MYGASRWLTAVASSGTRPIAPPWRKMTAWLIGLSIRAPCST